MDTSANSGAWHTRLDINPFWAAQAAKVSYEMALQLARQHPGRLEVVAASRATINTLHLIHAIDDIQNHSALNEINFLQHRARERMFETIGLNAEQRLLGRALERMSEAFPFASGPLALLGQ